MKNYQQDDELMLQKKPKADLNQYNGQAKNQKDKQSIAQYLPKNQHVAISPPWYYAWAIALARPLYRFRLTLNQNKLPYYHQELAQRFGGVCQRPIPKIHGLINKKVIWCHAVSLGELNTVYPLLKSLLDDGHGLYITSTTQTGFNRAEQLFAKEIANKQVEHGFVPIDDKAVLYRFLMHLNPHLVLLVETELWANTLYALAVHRIPTVLVNARLNQHSFLRYQKFAKLSSGMMANLTQVLAQDEISAQRFVALGLDDKKCMVMDSLKWSIGVNQADIHAQVHDLKTALGIDGDIKRPIWVAGSTHAGEEQALLLAHQTILQKFANALLVLVPRHPERFSAVADLCQASGLNTARRSQNHPLAAQTQVYLADSMGELVAWYALADVAVVGGSFVDVGGHNPVEPAISAKPIIMGQYVQSCHGVVDELKAVGALSQIASLTQVDNTHTQNATIDSDKIAQTVMAWFKTPSLATQSGQAGYQLAITKQDVIKAQLAQITAYL